MFLDTLLWCLLRQVLRWGLGASHATIIFLVNLPLMQLIEMALLFLSTTVLLRCKLSMEE